MSLYIQSYVALPTEEPVARDLAHVAVTVLKAAEAASVRVSEAHMLTMPCFW